MPGLKWVVLNHIQNPMSLHVPGTLNWNRFHWEEQGIGDVILQDVCNTTGTPVIHGGTHTQRETPATILPKLKLYSNMSQPVSMVYLQFHAHCATVEWFPCTLSLFIHLIHLYVYTCLTRFLISKKNSWEMLRAITSKCESSFHLKAWSWQP